MTAYPATHLVDYEDGYRTTITAEDASDTDTERGALKVLTIEGAGVDETHGLRIRLSPEAVDALVKALMRTK